MRDGTPVGQVRASMYLPAGYVKLEGATVNRENYPRLVALADSYNLWTSDTTANPGLFGEGDGTDTMVLPNWTGRMAQFAATAGGKVDAGLPNVTGQADIAPNGSTECVTSGFVGALEGIGSGTTFAFEPSSRALPGFYGIKLNASLSSPIYSASSTVQPPAINTFAIMRY